MKQQIAILFVLLIGFSTLTACSKTVPSDRSPVSTTNEAPTQPVEVKAVSVSSTPSTSSTTPKMTTTAEVAKSAPATPMTSTSSSVPKSTPTSSVKIESGTTSSPPSTSSTSMSSGVSKTTPTTSSKLESGSTASTSVVTPSPAPDGITKMITYTTPSGSENIEFTLIAHRGVVWALTVTPKAKNSTNLEHQKAFAQAISTEVIGKRIRDLHLTVIGGASLETGAFNQFITQL